MPHTPILKSQGKPDSRSAGNDQADIPYQIEIEPRTLQESQTQIAINHPRHSCTGEHHCQSVCCSEMAPVWPETMLTKIELNEEGPDRTRVTVTWEPYGSTTPEEFDAFIKMRGSMTQGWTGSFDKLEALVADVS